MKRVSIFLVAIALIAGMAGCDDTSQNLEIWDWYDLDAIRDNLDGDHILMNDLDSKTAGYEELAGPAANGGKGWDPIGTRYDWFEGIFDGQGYEIHDVFISRPDENLVGVFRLATRDAYIENIGVLDINVTGYNWVGGLAGQNSGTVSHCYSTGSVTGNFAVGGLLGDIGFDGTVSNSYSTGSVTGDWPIGGLVGHHRTRTVSNSYYNYDEVLINGDNIITIGALFGEDFEEWLANDKFLDVNERLSQEDSYYVVNNVTDFKELLAFGQDGSLKFRLKNDLDLASEPGFYIPYLAGEFDGDGHKISNLSLDFDFAHYVGLFGYLAPGGKVTQVGVENVNITGRAGVGSLAGWNRGTVSNSYCTGNVFGNYTVGGLVGQNTDILSNSYSTSSVNGDRDVGGLVGYSSGTVSNSYATGNVTGDEYVGGLVGRNGGDVSDSYSTGNVTGYEYVGGLVGYNYEGTLSKSYSTGKVTGGSDVGGLVGRNYYFWSTVSNSFWDIQTSGQPTSDGGTGKNTTEMKSIATFTDTETEGLDEPWDIIAVGGPGERNPVYIWNIVHNETYPFLSWQPV